jgi:predicted RNA binding protein YcfA (HicA-like mRNA interferase family)
MGQLDGFRYREIVQRLKQFGFQFDRQAAGSHEIWYNPIQTAIQPYPIILEICRKGHCERF